LIDFSAFGFDARSLDHPDPLWTSFKGELPKPVPSLLRPSTEWLNNQSGKRSWNDGPSTTQNWMNAGQDWGQAQQSSEWYTTDGPMTRSNGFPVVVTRLAEGRIGVLRGQADQIVPPGETTLVLIAPDAFGHVSEEAQVELSLSLARFNGRTGQLLVQPPEGAQQALELQLTAMDQDGEKATTTFRLTIQPTLSTPEGRMSFSDKLRQSAGVTLSAALFNMGGPLRHGQN
jgi:hypothetical protein